MAKETMGNEEARAMMNLSIVEIRQLRERIAYLQPKADAYDVLSKVMSLIPDRSQPMERDLVWMLEARIKELVDPVDVNIDKPLPEEPETPPAPPPVVE